MVSSGFFSVFASTRRLFVRVGLVVVMTILLKINWECSMYQSYQDLNLGGGLGVIAWTDAEGEGALKTTNIGGIYSYKFILIPRKSDVQVGLQANFVNKSIDWNRFVFSDQLDPAQGNILPTAAVPGSASKVFADFNAGIIWRVSEPPAGRHWASSVGLALQHLTQPNQSLTGNPSKLPMKLTVHGSLYIPVDLYKASPSMYFAPALIYEQQANFQTFNVGGYFMKKPIFFGLWYRNRSPVIDFKNSDAVIFHIGLRSRIKKIWAYQIGYSYDITISKLGLPSSAGSHEISIIFEYDYYKLTNVSGLGQDKSNSCPDFYGTGDMPKF